MTGLTTHALDTATGRPASGLKLDLYMLVENAFVHVSSAKTDGDGRPDGGPLLPADLFTPGTYEIVFHVGEYFADLDDEQSKTSVFLDLVPIRFVVADSLLRHHHVPLVFSPFGYSTYRGS